MKNIFITGVSRGLGKELFEQFTDKGYFVFGLLRDKNQYEKLIGKKPSNSDLILADITSDNCVEIIKKSIKDVPVDLLINNAGVGGNASKLENSSSEEILRLFNTHCVGVLRVTNVLLSNLLSNSSPMVLNINSRMGSITSQSKGIHKNLTVSYSYRIAKASQNMLTNCMRNEFGEKIKFISLHPGKLKTGIGQVDADISPGESAKQIIEAWEMNKLKVENGIIELPYKLIEW
jgi:short-subunit dehydrogenase